MEKIERVVLNTTFHVDADADATFVAWLGDSYLPGLRKEKDYEVLTVSRLLMQVEEGLVSYAVRVAVPGEPVQMALRHCDDLLSVARLEGIKQLVGNKVLYFTTPMVDITL